jgi:Predicted membrane protein involved in D-alanine export
MLLAASYFFYAAWDWRFLFLLILSNILDFYFGRAIERAQAGQARKLLILSISLSLGILGFFKYFNFFADSFRSLLHFAGFQAHISTLNIILPVGISFYTFQSISYIADVYRKKNPGR